MTIIKVYVLQHVHSLVNGVEDAKLIGVYSSRDNALAAITRLSCAPGFSEASHGFTIDEYPLDEDHWVNGYTNCFGEEKIAF